MPELLPAISVTGIITRNPDAVTWCLAANEPDDSKPNESNEPNDYEQSSLNLKSIWHPTIANVGFPEKPDDECAKHQPAQFHVAFIVSAAEEGKQLGTLAAIQQFQLLKQQRALGLQ